MNIKEFTNHDLKTFSQQINESNSALHVAVDDILMQYNITKFCNEGRHNSKRHNVYIRKTIYNSSTSTILFVTVLTLFFVKILKFDKICPNCGFCYLQAFMIIYYLSIMLL